METLAQKRKMVLAGLQLPEGVVCDGAAIVYSVEEPETTVEAPFFGGYMEDMLEDMGVVGQQEEAEERIYAMA